MSSTKGINRQSLAERLAAVFEATGESQREIADRTGVAQSFVSKVARGVCLPSLELLVGLDEAYGVNIVWLLRGEGEMMQATKSRAVAPAAHEAFVMLNQLADHGPDALDRASLLLQGLLGAYTPKTRQARAG